jgi:hypothetical protein
MRRPGILAGALGALVLAGAVPAFAAGLGVSSSSLTAWQSSACTSPGTQTVAADADSWIEQGSPTSNNGAESVLRVRSQLLGGNRRALARFELPALPANCTVTSATLRMYQATGGGGRTLQARRVAASWSESTVNWNNQPATAGTAASTTSGVGWRQWTVTTQVAAMYTSGNYGFLIRDAAEDALLGAEQVLNSRERAPDNPPGLVVTFG